MARVRTILTRGILTLAILTALAGFTVASPTPHALAGAPAIKVGYTSTWAIHVLGYYFSPNTKVRIYEFPDGSKSGYAIHYASTDGVGHFDTTFMSGVCAYSTDTIAAYDFILGWSNPVTLPAGC
jgi:hypothetical protein